MKIRACATFIGGLVFAVATVPAAGQSVQIYGQVRLTVNSLKAGAVGEMKELRDNASRLGFRGSEDLSGGQGAMYGLEMGVDADTGAGTVPAYRNSYVGLRGDWGARPWVASIPPTRPARRFIRK